MGHEEMKKMLKQLAKEVFQLENKVSDLGDCLSSILEDLQGASESSDGLSVRPPRRPKPGRQPGDTEKDQVLRAQAKAGVSRVDVLPLSNGCAKVTIDGGVAMRLSPVLANLMRALCETGDGSLDDGLVGYKSLPELSRLLGKKVNREVKRQAVREAVRRLRQTLIRHQYNPYLVENHRENGYRFALRRPKDPVTIADDV